MDYFNFNMPRYFELAPLGSNEHDYLAQHKSPMIQNFLDTVYASKKSIKKVVHFLRAKNKK